MKSFIFRLQLLFVLSFLLSTSCKKTSLADKIGVCCGLDLWELLCENGYAYAEIGAAYFLVPLESDSVFEKNLVEAKASGFPVYSSNSFFPGSIRLTGEGVDLDQIRSYTETTVKRAKQLGIKIMVLGSGGSRNIPNDFSYDEARTQFIAVCQSMGTIAQKYDITITVEPLQRAECNFINTVEEGLEIVKEVNHPNIALLADIFHMTRENESPESIVKAGKYLKHCHIAENEKRTPPGVMGDDFTPYFEALKQISYNGRLSIECGWENREQQLPVAMSELKRQIESVGL